MDHSTDKVHVIPIDGRWEVENQEGEVLSTEATEDDAIRVAEERATEQDIKTVILHDGHGVTEEVPVSTPFDNP